MNIKECANCLMHNWGQVEDQTKLQQCKKCKLIKYCGKDCQTEHWHRVHQKQCKYFADPIKAQRWEHKEDDCYICQQAAEVGEANLKRADNPNYECIFKEFQFPSSHHHPHPFPFNGKIGDTHEKGIIVLWQLIGKFQLIQPRRVIRKCQEELQVVIDMLGSKRTYIWRNRKIFPRSEVQNWEESLINTKMSIDLEATIAKLWKNKPVSDPFELWKVIELVSNILINVNLLEGLKSLKDPLSTVPQEFHVLVSHGLANFDKYLSLVNQVLDALATRVIPYQDVLKIICGGSLKKRCSYCFQPITIADVPRHSEKQGPIAFFEPLFMGVYSCGGDDCDTTMIAKVDYESTILVAATERKNNRCDFCFLLSPTKDVHRCSSCLSTLYCSKECQLEDWKIHQMVCKEDVEERKIKGGKSRRKTDAKDAVKSWGEVLETEFEKEISESDWKIGQFCDVVERFKAKKCKK